MIETFMTIMKMMLKIRGPGVLRHFMRQCQKPREMQENLLLRLIRKNQETRFGKDYGFKNIQNLRDFQKQVPILSYEEIKPYIDRTMNGGSNELTAERPSFFAMTSGTTGAPKFIPVTLQSRKAKAQVMNVWVTKTCLDHPSVLDGNCLCFVSPEVETHAPDGRPCGAESGYSYRHMPFLVKNWYSAPYGVFKIEDYELKYYTLLRLAAAQSISVLYTCNPSTCLILADRLGRSTESIIRDVRNGSISWDGKVSRELTEFYRSQIKPNPERAKFLEEVAGKAGGRLLPKNVWPDLSLICCWKGGSMSTYLSRFPRYYSSSTPVRDIGYFSSEFRGSVPLSDMGADGALAIPTNVYEFFPADVDHKPEGPELLTVDQLKKGKRYFIYVTTWGGLYRYDMNDIIEVTGLYEKTPLIHFVQKGNGIVSFTGEKLSEAQVIGAVGRAFESIKGHYEFIAAVGETPEDTPRYAFLVEFDKPIEKESAKTFADQIESILCELNIEYAGKRKSKRLDPVVIKVVPKGTFDSYRKQSVENGANDGQFKILKLTDDESFAKNFPVEMEVSAVDKANGLRFFMI